MHTGTCPHCALALCTPGKEEYTLKKHFLLGLLGLILILFISFLYNTSAQDIRNIDIQEKMSFLKTVVYRPFLSPSTDKQEEMLLLKAVEAGGFQMEEFNINISTFIPDTFLTTKEMEAIQEDIMRILNINKKITVIDMDSMRDSYYPPYQNYFEDISDIGEETILDNEDGWYIQLPRDVRDISYLRIRIFSIKHRSWPLSPVLLKPPFQRRPAPPRLQLLRYSPPAPIAYFFSYCG
jgi:hypothetical protein